MMPEETPELAKPAGTLIGDNLVKATFTLMVAGILGFGGWMWSMYETQRETQHKLSLSTTELTTKLDVLSGQIDELKSDAKNAESIARENTRRIDHIQNTRFTESDAKEAIEPLKERIDRLEVITRPH